MRETCEYFRPPITQLRHPSPLLLWDEGITRAVVTKKWRSWRVCIQNEDVHIARNSYFKFGTPKLVISYQNESLVVPFSHWVQLLLKIFHWDKPAIVISHWNESLVVPSFPLRDKALAEYIFEMRMSIKPETPTFNLTCNFQLKYKIYSLLIFPIEMSPWLSLLSCWKTKVLQSTYLK